MVTRCFFPRFVLAATLALPALLAAQQDPSKKQQQAPSPENRITIIVTGGDSEKPVEDLRTLVRRHGSEADNKSPFRPSSEVVLTPPKDSP